MGTVAQKRALKTYRSGLTERGLARVEIVVPSEDRATIRAIAKQLANGGAQAAKIRETANARVEKYVPKKGGIIEALLQSPLAGSGVKFKRYRGPWRKVEL